MALQCCLGDRLVSADLALELLDALVPHLVVPQRRGVRHHLTALRAAQGTLVLGVSVQGQHTLGDELLVAVGATHFQVALLGVSVVPVLQPQHQKRRNSSKENMIPPEKFFQVFGFYSNYR